jgi:hypothetical protein
MEERVTMKLNAAKLFPADVLEFETATLRALKAMRRGELMARFGQDARLFRIETALRCTGCGV